LRTVRPRLCNHACLTADDVLAAIELDDSRSSNALREVLVGSTNDHPIDGRVFAGSKGGGGQRIVGLEFNHWPSDHAKRGEGFFKQWKLSQEIGFDTFSGLIDLALRMRIPYPVRKS
jgi:hypothetical protein